MKKHIAIFSIAPSFLNKRRNSIEVKAWLFLFYLCSYPNTLLILQYVAYILLKLWSFSNTIHFDHILPQHNPTTPFLHGYIIPLSAFKIEQASMRQQPKKTKQNTIRQGDSIISGLKKGTKQEDKSHRSRQKSQNTPTHKVRSTTKTSS